MRGPCCSRRRRRQLFSPECNRRSNRRPMCARQLQHSQRRHQQLHLSPLLTRTVSERLGRHRLCQLLAEHIPQCSRRYCSLNVPALPVQCHHPPAGQHRHGGPMSLPGGLFLHGSESDGVCAVSSRLIFHSLQQQQLHAVSAQHVRS